MRKLLLGLIGLLFAVPAVATDLPAGYTELQYIESTGTQYINTGVPVSNDLTFGYKAAPKVANQISISQLRSGSGGRSGLIVWQSGGYINIRYTSNGSSFTAGTNVPYQINQVFDIIFNDNNNFYINGVLAYTKTNTIDTSGVLVTGIADRVYNLWVKSNTDGSLIFNGIPCRRNSDNVLGMYDTVNNEFFTNQGTGEFIAGPVVSIRIATTAYNSARFSPVVTELNDTIATIRSVVTNTINQTKAIADLQATKQTRPNENCPAGKKCLLVEDDAGMPHWYEIIENAYGLPSGYTGLEYLQSDGASYLIVPYRVNNKTVFYCRYNEIRNSPQIANAVFGVTTSPDVSKANNGILRLTGSSFDRMGWGNSVSGSLIDVNAPKEFNTWYEVLYDQNKLYQNDRLYATSATQTNVSWVAEYDLGVFARNSASVSYPAIAKISSVWAKENGEYKINLIPARRNSDNVLGMYDTVSGEFFTNKGSGTFTAGPDI